MKLHEAERCLRLAGFVFIRQRGTSHQIWKRGNILFVLACHKGKELSRSAEMAIRIFETGSDQVE
jgi:predicted RNA binding protein YcfA (HicA-like mRNA interferase family)